MNLISINDLDKRAIEQLITDAGNIKKDPGHYSDALQDKIIAMLFFEPSTRTRLSFESAANRLGARVIGFSDASSTSTKKGETLEDTITVISGYTDAIVMRHGESGAATRAFAVTKLPIINAGDGSNEHPSQALLDFFTIAEKKSTIEGVKIAFVGDLLYGRTVHSLAQGLTHFNPTMYFVSPPSLKMPEKIQSVLKEKEITYHETESWDEIAQQVDVLYMTRVQQERFDDPKEYERLKDSYILNKETAALFRDDCIFMHPLPRVNEIAPEVDEDPRAVYFEEAHNGVWLRMALLKQILT